MRTGAQAQSAKDKLPLPKDSNYCRIWDIGFRRYEKRIRFCKKKRKLPQSQIQYWYCTKF
jgi:hypothetical protein